MSKIEILNSKISPMFSVISTQRTNLMGIAMLWVFLFHTPSTNLGYMPTGLWGSFIGHGSWGVDIFMFLSAFGLCFSLSKNSLRKFYYNRFVRIIPIWILMIFLIHIAGIVISSKISNIDFTYPKSIADCFFWYTGLGFFFDKCHYEWYVPTILAFYLISPMLYKLRPRYLVLLYLASFFTYWMVHESADYNYLSICLERLPVFILGFLFYKLFKEGKIVEFLITDILLILVTSLTLRSETIIFGLSCPIILMTVGWVLSLKWMKYFNLLLTLLGMTSLEFYLIHLYRRPQYLFSFFTEDCVLQIILAFILCLLIAFIMHVIANRLTALINKLCQNKSFA